MRSLVAIAIALTCVPLLLHLRAPNTITRIVAADANCTYRVLGLEPARVDAATFEAGEGRALSCSDTRYHTFLRSYTFLSALNSLIIYWPSSFEPDVLLHLLCFQNVERLDRYEGR